MKYPICLNNRDQKKRDQRSFDLVQGSAQPDSGHDCGKDRQRDGRTIHPKSGGGRQEWIPTQNHGHSMHYAGGRAQDVPQDGGIPTRSREAVRMMGLTGNIPSEHDMQLVLADPRVLP